MNALRLFQYHAPLRALARCGSSASGGLRVCQKPTCTYANMASFLGYRYLSTSSPSQSSALRFAKTHEWLRVDGEEGTVGLSEHATDALGDVVYVELPDPETELEASSECGVIESVKAASDLYAPVSGVVTAKNEAVEKEPSLLNRSCMEDGWLFKLKLTDPGQTDTLMDEEQYKQYLDGLQDNDD